MLLTGAIGIPLVLIDLVNTLVSGRIHLNCSIINLVTRICVLLFESLIGIVFIKKSGFITNRELS